jgi:hypothetical protein
MEDRKMEQIIVRVASVTPRDAFNFTSAVLVSQKGRLLEADFKSPASVVTFETGDKIAFRAFVDGMFHALGRSLDVSAVTFE